MLSSAVICDWKEELYDLVTEQLDEMYSDYQDHIKSEYINRYSRVNQEVLYSLMIEYGYDLESALEILE